MKNLNFSFVLFAVPFVAAVAQTPASTPKRPPVVVTPGTPATTAATAPSAAAVEVAPDAIVLSVGSQKLTRAQFEMLLQQLPEQVRASVMGTGRRKLAEQLADVLAMSEEAKKRKLDQLPEMKVTIEFQADNVLAARLYKELNANAQPDSAALHAYFDAHKSEYEQVKARHILIRYKGSPVPLKPGQKDLTPEEALAKAQELRSKIKGGADFAAIAKAESDDTGSGANGGDLPRFGRKQMVAEFEKAAFALPVSEVSEPVKTQFGYHVIQVEERKPVAFEDVRDKIEPLVKTEMARKAVEDLKKQSNVTINDKYFPQ